MTVAPIATPSPERGRRGLLAIALQEAFTAVARLRSNRQVAADAESFRAHVKQVLAGAEQSAQAAGYAIDDVRTALFAVIVFLDESVLNSAQPMFADWPRRPLQEEIFGSHTGGELFFQYLVQAVQGPDTEDAADLLEVFALCLLLGFRGRYAASTGNELTVIVNRVLEKLRKIRGPSGELSPKWRPSAAPVPLRRDRWTLPVAIVAVIALVGAAGLFTFYSMSLRAGRADVAASLGQLAPPR
jgi:type VI secretion system protein ImpK